MKRFIVKIYDKWFSENTDGEQMTTNHKIVFFVIIIIFSGVIVYKIIEDMIEQIWKRITLNLHPPILSNY